MRPVRLSLAAAVAVFAAACGDEPAAIQQETNPLASFDVATFVGDAVAEDVSLLRTQEGAFGVPSADASLTGEWRNDCTYSAATARFLCPVLSHEGRTVARSYQLLDASGRPQAAYDATTTASANFLTTIIGTVSRDDFIVSFGRDRNITVTGLAGSETQHTVNGAAARSNARTQHSAQGPLRSYTMTAGAAIVNVIVPFPRPAGAWPLQGTITWQVAFSRDIAGGSEKPTSLTAIVRFNGTQLVPLDVSGQSYTLDLATGKVVRG
jgi:hypothetical protein